jgi:hypothetical protein
VIITIPGILPRVSIRDRGRRCARPVRRHRDNSASQQATALDEQRQVDRLVAHLHHRIVGELDAQLFGDLLR